MAWAIPTVAATTYAPAYAASPSTTTTTLLPCVSNLGATGGTYPVSISLSGCGTPSSHWDFIFKITAALQTGTACDCAFLRITFFDNPKRTRLWISNNSGNTGGNPSTNTADSPRLYVQKVLAAGATASFPATGDAVRRVGGAPPYTSFTTDSGTASVGTIAAPGLADDSLHTLILPNGSVPCSATGPMAYYRVECGQAATGPWTQLGPIGEINPCVPMIQATVCRFDATGTGRYRLGISVLNACGIPPATFRVTNIQRNDDVNFPNVGGSVWTGNQQLGPGTTNIDMTGTGSGGQLWISFTTDGGANTSQIRVPTNNTSCPVTPPVIVRATNNQTSCPTGNRTIAVTWTGVTTKIQYRVAQSDGTFSGDWTNQNVTTSPGTISLSNATTKCRAVQVRLCGGGGTTQTCEPASSSTVTVPQLGR